jgi:thioredoxin reductase (NADPH)
MLLKSAQFFETSCNFRFLFADQDVVVIGGGDTAMEDALVLARTSRSVVVIHRRDKFRASKVQSLSSSESR